MTDTAIKTDAQPEIDKELLEEAQRQLGATSPNEAINIALLDLVADRRARRRRALEELQRMAEEEPFDWGAIAEADR
jgi:Arc/MetJ family transcription regulator